VQAVAADDLKRDQFKFLYKVHEMLFNTALKPQYLKEVIAEPSKATTIFTEVIPQLVVL
jgi:hypothetical protein